MKVDALGGRRRRRPYEQMLDKRWSTTPYPSDKAVTTMDHSQPNRRLSEISHLFLSDVRDKTPGGERPKRLPPGTPPGAFRNDVSIDLTPEEFAKAFGGESSEAAKPEAKFKPVRAVIAHHLGEIMSDRVRDLAAMLGTRTGVIYADAANVRICCVDRSMHQSPRTEEVEPDIEVLNTRKLEEIIVELDQDVTNWIIVLSDPRQNEAGALLRQIKHWTLLSGVDHDAVVAGYRTLKGLCESARPALSVAVFGATDEDELHKTYRKLASVCEQFLHMQIGLFGGTEPSDAPHGCILTAQDQSDGEAAHWRVLGKLVQESETPAETAAPAETPVEEPKAFMTPVMAEIPAAKVAPIPSPVATPSVTPPAPLKLAQTGDTIIDLGSADTTAPAILSAVVRGTGEWVESPIKAPACPEAIVAVSRDGRLVLLAAAKQGLNELRSINKAYAWLDENRQLVSMALPQMSINAGAKPQLHLLVDHADANDEALSPMLMTGNVQATTYRTLRWGDRTGLLLDAA